MQPTFRNACVVAMTLALAASATQAQQTTGGREPAQQGPGQNDLPKEKAPQNPTSGDGTSKGPGTVSTPSEALPKSIDETLRKLHSLNIGYSVPETDLREWLANAEFTSYAALAAGTIRLLGERALKKTLDIDVIVYNYESVAGDASPRTLEDVDNSILTKAILTGFNARYGGHAQTLSDILK